MSKLPAFQFYPGDWRKDPCLARSSKAAKGVWIDMLCLMFECPIRGVLADAGGSAWSDQEIAEAIGGDTSTNLECIAELLGKGVASRNNRGAIFSRRLVRDEGIRQATKERVEKHRSNKVVTQKKRACTEDEDEDEEEVVVVFSLPDWISKEVWKDYEEMRKRIRKRMTERAKQLAVQELTKLRAKGHSPEAVLNQSIMNSWQGLFPVRKGNLRQRQADKSAGFAAEGYSNDPTPEDFEWDRKRQAELKSGGGP